MLDKISFEPAQVLRAPDENPCVWTITSQESWAKNTKLTSNENPNPPMKDAPLPALELEDCPTSTDVASRKICFENRDGNSFEIGQGNDRLKLMVADTVSLDMKREGASLVLDGISGLSYRTGTTSQDGLADATIQRIAIHTPDDGKPYAAIAVEREGVVRETEVALKDGTEARLSSLFQQAESRQQTDGKLSSGDKHDAAGEAELPSLADISLLVGTSVLALQVLFALKDSHRKAEGDATAVDGHKVNVKADGLLRDYVVDGKTYKFGGNNGWFYSETFTGRDGFPLSEGGNLKIHVFTLDRADLARVQAELIPELHRACQPGGPLHGKVAMYKTHDPMFGVSETWGPELAWNKNTDRAPHVPGPRGQQAKGFTIYPVDAQSAKEVQLYVDQFLKSKGLALAGTLDTGNIGDRTVNPEGSNRTSFERDTFEVGKNGFECGAVLGAGFEQAIRDYAQSRVQKRVPGWEAFKNASDLYDPQTRLLKPEVLSLIEADALLDGKDTRLIYTEGNSKKPPRLMLVDPGLQVTSRWRMYADEGNAVGMEQHKSTGAGLTGRHAIYHLADVLSEGLQRKVDPALTAVADERAIMSLPDGSAHDFISRMRAMATVDRAAQLPELVRLAHGTVRRDLPSSLQRQFRDCQLSVQEVEDLKPGESKLVVLHEGKPASIKSIEGGMAVTRDGERIPLDQFRFEIRIGKGSSLEQCAREILVSVSDVKGLLEDRPISETARQVRRNQVQEAIGAEPPQEPNNRLVDESRRQLVNRFSSPDGRASEIKFTANGIKIGGGPDLPYREVVEQLVKEQQLELKRLEESSNRDEARIRELRERIAELTRLKSDIHNPETVARLVEAMQKHVTPEEIIRLRSQPGRSGAIFKGAISHGGAYLIVAAFVAGLIAASNSSDVDFSPTPVYAPTSAR